MARHKGSPCDKTSKNSLPRRRNHRIWRKIRLQKGSYIRYYLIEILSFHTEIEFTLNDHSNIACCHLKLLSKYNRILSSNYAHLSNIHALLIIKLFKMLQAVIFIVSSVAVVILKSFQISEISNRISNRTSNRTSS